MSFIEWHITWGKIGKLTSSLTSMLLFFSIRFAHIAVDRRFVVPRGKGSISSRKRALSLTILEPRHIVHVRALRVVRIPLACWVFHDRARIWRLGNTHWRGIWRQSPSVRIQSSPFVQCCIFHRSGVELRSCF